MPLLKAERQLQIRSDRPGQANHPRGPSSTRCTYLGQCMGQSFQRARKGICIPQFSCSIQIYINRAFYKTQLSQNIFTDVWV